MIIEYKIRYILYDKVQLQLFLMGFINKDRIIRTQKINVIIEPEIEQKSYESNFSGTYSLVSKLKVNLNRS